MVSENSIFSLRCFYLCNSSLYIIFKPIHSGIHNSSSTMSVLQTTFSLQYYFVYSIVAILSTHAAFVPTTTLITSTNKRTFPHHLHTVYLSKPNSSRSLTNIQEVLSDIDKFKTALSSPAYSLDNDQLLPSPPSPPPPFDPTNPKTLIAITKSFIATDFGIQSSQLPDYSTGQKTKQANNDSITITTSALPYYSSSLLSQDFNKQGGILGNRQILQSTSIVSRFGIQTARFSGGFG